MNNHHKVQNILSHRCCKYIEFPTLKKIHVDSGTIYEEGVQLIGEFQKMRTMMSRMQKQMGGNPAMGEGEQAIPVGSRVLCRAAKKKKKEQTREILVNLTEKN